MKALTISFQDVMQSKGSPTQMSLVLWENGEGVDIMFSGKVLGFTNTEMNALVALFGASGAYIQECDLVEKHPRE